MSTLTSSFTLVGLLTLVVLQRLQHAYSERVRILGSLLLVLFSLASAATLSLRLLLLPEANLAASLAASALTNGGLLVLMAMVGSVGQGILVASLVSYATIFDGPLYMQAVMGGQALAGLLVSLANIGSSLSTLRRRCDTSSEDLAAALFDEGARAAHAERAVLIGALCYFGLAAAVTLLCLGSYLVLERLPFTQYSRMRATRKDADSRSDASSEEMRGSGAAGALRDGDLALASARLTVGWWACTAVLIFGCTLALFPSLTSTIMAAPTGSCKWRAVFTPFMFATFNAGDLIGRNLSCCLPRHCVSACSIAACRVIFAPLFVLALDPSSRPDALPLLTMLAFALTNGWLCTTIFVRGPAEVPPVHRPAVGSLLVLYLNIGLTLGSLLSFAVRWLICSCNPFLS
eukprot:CAMPEP_0174737920 /NCGR_PEP_ID=MMETSP1094-20130205/69062_1 /TAXON_ID=156173 /ORGANISM="Chrysochromulina brevifilum, Strain UTEX LB 985" /LENGTH=403 /DNA_ID=CAMNT_0015941225 /DNA_START=87 /DNA_END=1298 /DNA_ORIENTATION=-